VFTTAPRPTWKWEEQFGLAYVEAQACGLPVVTTACGSNHEAIAPGNDVIAVEGSEQVQALADALVGWLTDPQRRRARGRANRDWVVEHHDLRTQTRRMGEAFAEMERLHGRV